MVRLIQCIVPLQNVTEIRSIPGTVTFIISLELYYREYRLLSELICQSILNPAGKGDAKCIHKVHLLVSFLIFGLMEINMNIHIILYPSRWKRFGQIQTGS